MGPMLSKSTKSNMLQKLLLEHKTEVAELRQSQESHNAAKEADKETIEKLTQVQNIYRALTTDSTHVTIQLTHQ